MKRQYQTIADYAAIAIAPLLIFWMLVSLASFLMLVLYQGNYSERVMWTLMCYTMGATALARLTIQESRHYASVYATALGVTTFFVMFRFVGDPIFSAAIIFTIGYLADRIVHDCTIVEDGTDSSGQGLVDSGRRWIENQWSRHPRRSPNSDVATSRTETSKMRKAIGKQGHQPGRTVLYLAFGALPLFGIGQFFLRDAADSWQRAKWSLALYLFTSLSLLVVTSFLNLRRYLRQRNTEMPSKVTVSWLAGGGVMILLVLLIAFIAPLPGQAIVSFQVPEFLKNRDSTLASRFGWGEEGADEPGEGASPQGAPRPDAQEPPGAPEVSSQPQAGAPPGGNQGQRDDGPTGQESGGTKNSQKSAESKPSPESSEKAEASAEGEDEQGEGEQGEGKNGDEEKSQGGNEDAKPSEAKQEQGESEQTKGEQAEGDADSADKPQPEQPQPEQPQPEQPQPEQPQRQSEPPDLPPQSQDNPQPPPADWSGMLPGIAGVLKFLLIAALLLVIAVYVYLNRVALLAWFQRLFGGAAEERAYQPSAGSPSKPVLPSRPFSSFANPVGSAAAAEVIVVTFQALEAWGREQGVPRRADETPSEYTQRLAAAFPNLARSAVRVVDAYNRIVYGRAHANNDDVTAASTVWQIMRPQL